LKNAISYKSYKFKVAHNAPISRGLRFARVKFRMFKISSIPHSDFEVGVVHIGSPGLAMEVLEMNARGEFFKVGDPQLGKRKVMKMHLLPYLSHMCHMCRWCSQLVVHQDDGAMQQCQGQVSLHLLHEGFCSESLQAPDFSMIR
jgi:hypothetical protein